MDEELKHPLRDILLVNVNDNIPYDVYIGRGSIWGNPFKIGHDGTRGDVVRSYEKYLIYHTMDLEILRNKVLGCHCYPKLCHGDILLKHVYLYDKFEIKTGLLEIIS